MAKQTILGIRKSAENSPDPNKQTQLESASATPPAATPPAAEPPAATPPAATPPNKPETLYRPPIRRQEDGSSSPKAPPRSTFKPLPTLPEAANAAGDVFHPGDLIQVRGSMGGFITATIKGFYQDSGGSPWATFNHPDIETGCIQATCLKRG